MIWSRLAFADALSTAKVFVDGDWVESKDQDPEGDVRLIQLADVGDGYYIDKSNRFLTSSAAERLKCTFLEPGDVLIARMPDPLGRACIFPGDSKRAVTVVDVCVIRVDSKRMYAPWLVHCINSSVSRNQIDGYVTGTTRQRISRGNLGKIEIAVPPLPEQLRIAAILDQADALRAKRREALVQLDSLTQSIFIEMFGDPDENDKGLPVEMLGTLCKRITDGTHQSPKWETSGVPFLFISNIVDGQITFDTHKFISDETYLELTRRCQIELGDVLYTTVGSYGNAAVVNTTKRFAFQRHIAHIKPDVDRAIPSFVAAMIQSTGVRRQVDKVAKGVAQKTVNLADLKTLLVFAPPLALQKVFATRTEAVERLKTNHLAALAELDTLFASLQLRAFNGDL